ncbi:MAG: lysophospholipid acyltransferase family protein [Deltaproteobacteria bacterium]|nr:lysophospholipid acyltransferase family protein [Deltaproteobacteria bacterium]
MNRKSDQRAGLKWWLVGWLGKGLVDLIFKTMRIRVVGLEKARAEIESRRFIFAFWHSRILMASYLFKGWGGVALVSKSKDGEIITQILQRQGQETIRGSTSRHGVRAIITLAQKTGYPIVPISYSAKRLKVFASWDRFILPYPFNKGHVIYGTPISVPGKLDADERELHRMRLEEELNRITKTVDHRLSPHGGVACRLKMLTYYRVCYAFSFVAP